MRSLDLTLPTLEANLALDEALLLEAEEGGPETLRFWEWPTPAVVVGAGGKVAEETNAAACDAARVPIRRRSSGGGTVLLGSGCLLYSLVLRFGRNPLLADLHASYRLILERMIEALRPFASGAAAAGTSDLVVGDRKFSGNAQQRKRQSLLHHGTLLYAFDLPQIPRYLATPPRMPEYRHGRDHLAFVMNLAASSPELRSRIAEVWHADAPAENWPEQRVASLVAEKYADEAWHRRR